MQLSYSLSESGKPPRYNLFLNEISDDNNTLYELSPEPTSIKIVSKSRFDRWGRK